jgi:hypothetical protein
LAKLIERDVNLVPHLIEKHCVLVQVDDLLDVLVIVVPPYQVTLLNIDIDNLLFKPEATKTGPIHI